MKKIVKKKDSYGQDVIYVGECDKYLYEQQEVDITEKNERICDILYLIENYYEENIENDNKLRNFVNGGNK